MKKIVFIAFSLCVIIFGCSDDRLFPLDLKPESPVETVKPVFVSGNSDLMNLAELKGEIFRYNGLQDNPLYGPKGTKIYMPGINEMSFQDGKPITGSVQVELIEIYKPGDMIWYNKQTVSNGNILESGGQIYLNVTSDGKPVNISRFSRTYNVFFPGEDRGLMNLFYGEETVDGFMNWNTQEQGIGNSPDGIQNSVVLDSLERKQEGYSFYPARFLWINCDRFWSYTGEKTNIYFSSKDVAIENIRTFIVFPEINSVINVIGNKSLELPVGEKVKIVSYAITEDKDIYYFYQEHTAEKVSKIDIVLKKTTIEDFKKLLDAL